MLGTVAPLDELHFGRKAKMVKTGTLVAALSMLGIVSAFAQAAPPPY
jgi:hypothetical protein